MGLQTLCVPHRVCWEGNAQLTSPRGTGGEGAAACSCGDGEGVPLHPGVSGCPPPGNQVPQPRPFPGGRKSIGPRTEYTGLQGRRRGLLGSPAPCPAPGPSGPRSPKKQEPQGGRGRPPVGSDSTNTNEDPVTGTAWSPLWVTPRCARCMGEGAEAPR